MKDDFDEDERESVALTPGREMMIARVCLWDLSQKDEVFLFREELATIVKRKLPSGGLARPMIKRLTKADLRVILDSHYKFSDLRTGKIHPRSPEIFLSAAYHVAQSADINQLRNITRSPILLQDGTFFSEGYHEPNRLYVSAAKEPILAFDPMLQATNAVKVIRTHFSDVTFVSELDFSVFVAALMSAMMCWQIKTKPAFVISAEHPGSGKSALVRAISVLALGETVKPINHPRTEREFERQLDEALRNHPGIIAVDNITFPIQGARLCSIISEPETVLFSTKNKASIEVEQPLIFLNGNNVRIITADLARRTLTINLSSRQEASGDRLGSTWIEELTQRRDLLMPFMIQLLSAFSRAGRPRQKPALASFEDWSVLIRDAIVWSGLPDPVESQRQFASPVEPMYSGLQLLRLVTEGRRFTAADLMHLQKVGKIAEDEFRQTLKLLSGPLSAVRIGRALRTLSLQEIGPFRVRPAGGHAGSIRWQVEWAADD